MRALVMTGPGRAEVQELPVPEAGPGEVRVAVERVGVCGTDVELFDGSMAYLHDGRTHHPLRPGHEWAGTVDTIGAGVAAEWLGARVTGDTMLGCLRCDRCRSGRSHLCADRVELGITDGRPGALAEYVVVPATSLHRLPERVDWTLGALVEPGGNAWRAADAAGVGEGQRALVAGPGTIGLLTGLFLQARGVEVHLLGAAEASLEFARTLGLERVWLDDDLPDLAWHAVVDATNAADLPARALDLVEPGGRLVHIGLAGSPSLIDTRRLVLKDVTAVGILSASPGLAPAIAAYAEGLIDPRPLVAATVGLDDVVGVLRGERPPGSGAGPKVHVDPRAAVG